MNKLKMVLAMAGLLAGAWLSAARAEVFLIADNGASALRSDIFSSSTNAVSTQQSGFTAPTGIAISSDETKAYVVSSTSQITTLTLNPATLAVTGTSTSGFAGLTAATGVAVDSAGNVYVTNGANVAKYTSTGTTISSSFISGLTSAQYVTTDSAGNVYVTSAGFTGNVLSKYTSSGGSVAAFTTVSTAGGGAEGVKVFGANVYFADPTSGNTGIYRVATNATGSPTPVLNSTIGTANVALNSLAFDNAGNMFVVNDGSGGSKLYSGTAGTSGATLSTVGTSGTALVAPFDIVQAPEPSSLILTGLGVGVLGVYRRYTRRKKQAVPPAVEA